MFGVQSGRVFVCLWRGGVFWHKVVHCVEVCLWGSWQSVSVHEVCEAFSIGK